MIHEITLRDYEAVLPGGRSTLSLGTAESYGNESLRILRGRGWEALAVTATFVTGSESIRVLAGEDGTIAVPMEATAEGAVSRAIVFAGVGDGVQRITGDLRYTVRQHSPIEGPESEATPDLLEQILARLEQGGTGSGSGSGSDGITPHIGANGNWFLGDTDTGMPSRGQKGDPGQDGAPGQKGEKGDKGDPGEDGAQGPQGIQGPKGDTGAAGAQGPKGDPGNDGQTPVKGTDYWTEEDKAELVQQVQAQLDTYSRGEIDAALGSYITDIAALVGGDA